MDKLYTTNQLAKLFGVVPTTVIAWVEHGELEAWKTLGGHRRIRHGAVLDFLHRHRLPYPPAFADSAPKILVLLSSADSQEQFRDLLQSDQPQAQIFLASNPMAALLRIGGERPRLVVFDCTMPGLHAPEFCRAVRASAELGSLKLLAVAATEPEATDALAAGADAFLELGEVPRRLVEVSRTLLGLRWLDGGTP